eukprot:s621_g26.t1
MFLSTQMVLSHSNPLRPWPRDAVQTRRNRSGGWSPGDGRLRMFRNESKESLEGEEENQNFQRSLWDKVSNQVKPLGEEALGPQINSLRPNSARYSFARARNRAGWRSTQENTPGPGTYDVKDPNAAISASRFCGVSSGRPESARSGRPDSARSGRPDSARRMPEAPREEIPQEYLTYPLEAWECTTAATARKFMVFGTESRDAQVFDMDLLKECAHARYGLLGPGLVYNPDDRKVRPSSARHSFPRGRNSQVQSVGSGFEGVAPSSYQHDKDSIATKQASSKRRTAQAFSFGRASRFPATKRAEGARTAECVSGGSSLGRHALWTHRMAQQVPLDVAMRRKAATAFAQATEDLEARQPGDVSIFDLSLVDTASILSNVSCSFPPGRLSAVMGASGSGKTSVLTAIRGLQAAGSETCGEVVCNGMPVNMELMRHLAVPQEDVFLAALTPREMLSFAAELRLPQSWSEREQGSAIGDEKIGMRGISGWTPWACPMLKLGGGERRRLSVGMAIIGGLPQVLLCDEPTSRGVTVIAAIHQPSYSVFSEFDFLLLLEAGRIVYSGKVLEAEGYFSKHGSATPDKTNPAHHYVQDESSKWIENWEAFSSGNSSGKSPKMDGAVAPKVKHMPTLWEQTNILTRRTLLENFKNKKKWNPEALRIGLQLDGPYGRPMAIHSDHDPFAAVHYDWLHLLQHGCSVYTEEYLPGQGSDVSLRAITQARAVMKCLLVLMLLGDKEIVVKAVNK